MPRRFQTRRIKRNQAYRVYELADAAGVSTPTVRNWIKAGMLLVDAKRPIMILGFHALDFLKMRKAKAARPLAIGEFYCLSCKDARLPLGGMADYFATSAAGGRLKALCDVCEGQCCRNISARSLPAIGTVLDLAIRDNR